jgi:hypothetical protein
VEPWSVLDAGVDRRTLETSDATMLITVKLRLRRSFQKLGAAR